MIEPLNIMDQINHDQRCRNDLVYRNDMKFSRDPFLSAPAWRADTTDLMMHEELLRLSKEKQINSKHICPHCEKEMKCFAKENEFYIALYDEENKMELYSVKYKKWSIKGAKQCIIKHNAHADIRHWIAFCSDCKYRIGDVIYNHNPS